MTQPIKIAILALGGEGGGVLADWIVDLAEQGGHVAQSTSVPGVAQRTGATIYYVELYPRAQAQADGAEPVLALMPLPGDVDIVIASELMEAARAVQRGLVTPDRTVLIASTHRVYAILERIAMGDGLADSARLLGAARDAAQRFIGFDMAALAGDSPIGAVLFGVLAASGALPFGRADFEAAIRRGGVGVEASLRAFALGFEHAPEEPAPAVPATPAGLPKSSEPVIRALLERVAAGYPQAARSLVVEGLRRLVDYQDPAYAALYVDRMDRIRAIDGEGVLTLEVARHLALWMSYEDTIRVADLKTRDTRFTRVQAEMKLEPGQLLAIDEYLHPRIEEICDTLPAPVGAWLLRSGAPRRLVERLAVRGRVVRTSSLRGYLLLRAVAALSPMRRRMLRFDVEDARIREWLADVENAAQQSPALALEIARCQRLVKGYGDTHARGWRNFVQLQSLWRRAGPALAPLALRELRDAALADEQGEALRAALARHRVA